MEFYKDVYHGGRNECYGFNSQRDGILHISIRTNIAASMFQFPTGWNSTETEFLSEVEGVKVSIPNGMEFYITSIPSSFLPLLFQFPTGWNSTLVPCSTRSLSRVSIPNGMEFYSAMSRVRDLQKCFNSQRDGILHAYKIVLEKIKNCFNSQRDGILHNFALGIFKTSKVSIPNGMEFYL